ncbi:MAG: hypothetical protein UU48_C0006G0052 [Candidatus Uhrbacteria bacterium GW2011_GWF2_41_16]|uniref:Uncharacterized protein n=2 Tax=Candidatus Uhriibacteriota TaxID=1752732 RepID=A0A0G0YCF8_9BACT|nr:MAG: hypothetical protein UU35_C0007G0081 [Candidatus Uhrbacteria bacterium GW2011_GWC2_41_11]KKR98012.1 MAG: hypothetical protein UU48_C0006G0052 [Candidatus Uhrbacteria bacterium GW2011_GWF2_41_16]HBO99564.1 hypothetical protein [Candidatus Uhrbacteria bacterium]
MSEKEKWDPKARWMLIYAKDLKIPTGTDPKNVEMKNSRSYFEMMWFVAWNKTAREAVLAGRARIFEITDDKQHQHQKG